MENKSLIDAIARYKHHRPTRQHSLIFRAELMQQAKAKIVWLNAPAGFGKSTLMTQLADEQEQQGRHVLWLSFSAQPQTAAEFLPELVSACQQQLHITLEEAFFDYSLEQQIIVLQEKLQTLPKILMCLDNVQHLSDRLSWPFLIDFLIRCPENCRVFLAGRYLPHSLGALHLVNDLQWFGTDALRFNDDETQALLQQNHCLDTPNLVPTLNQYLQGWPAGLAIWIERYKRYGQLGHSYPKQIKRLASQALGDYLAGELLNELDTELIDFLRLCSVLGHFNESLLAHCCQTDSYHSSLRVALRLNLFIQPQPHQPDWYKMHPVLADYLVQQLPHSQRTALHKSAFEWLLENQHQSVSALRHALAADMTEQHQSWLMQEAEQVLAHLDFSSLYEWFEQMDQRFIVQHPRLLAIQCWTLALTLQHLPAQGKLQQLERLEYLQPYETYALKGYLARQNDDLEEAITLCQRALSLIPPSRFILKILLNSTLAQIALAQQQHELAEHYNQQASELAQTNQAPALEAVCLFVQARIEFYNGQLFKSQDSVDQALFILENQLGLAEFLPYGRLRLYKVFLMWMADNTQESLPNLLQQSINQCLQQRDPHACFGYALQAFMHSMQGKHQDALSKINSAEWLMQRWQIHPKNYQWLQIIRIHLWINQGKLKESQQLLDQFLADKDEDHLPTVELFPMLPGLVRLTQARIWLLSGQYQHTVAYIDQALGQSGSLMNRALLEIARAVAHQQAHPHNAPFNISAAVRKLQRENISVGLLHWLTQMHSNTHPPVSPQELLNSSALTKRELEVLNKMALGLTNQDIADQMFISLHTVKTHVRKIIHKLSVKSRTQAIVKAKELELL